MTTPVQNIIAGVSHNVLKYWLRSYGLRHSAANEDALIVLIEKLLEKGDLTIEGLKSGIREIEEHGGKRVYLKQLMDPSIISARKRFEKHLAQLDISLSKEKGDAIKLPSKHRVNYAIWSEDEVRIKYSEKHVHVQFDKRTRKHIDTPKTKYIVMSAEPKTGFLKIYMDPPGDEHPHTNERGVITDAAYTQFYFNRAKAIFGDIEDFELIQRTIRLLLIDPPIYEPTHDSGWTEDNYQYTIKGRADTRRAEMYKKAKMTNSGLGLPEFIRGHWLQEMSGDQLEKQLYMIIRPAESRIQFRADCLAKEVGYAISRIRTV